jgi:DNA-binding MurR/RpiR family transcriptional regulator
LQNENPAILRIAFQEILNMTSDAIESPASFEELITEIHAQYDSLSKTNQQIAVYVTQNPNEVAMNSVNSIAERHGIHPSSFVRFAQHFGFRGFKQLQGIFRKRLTTAAPGFETRAAQMRSKLAEAGAGGSKAQLLDLVSNDLASLEQLATDIDEKQLDHAIDLLSDADCIFLIGQLRSEPIVVLLRYILTMLGRRAVLIDAAGGLATHMGKVIGQNDVLLAVSFRYYAKEVVNTVEDAAARGIPVVAISDSTLSPLAKSATVLFEVPEREQAFSRSLAAPICLAQALMLGLAARQADGAPHGPLIPVVSAP